MVRNLHPQLLVPVHSMFLRQVASVPTARALSTSGGTVPEFINPKYADAAKNKFKSSTRLECMMQDFPKLLPSR